MENKQSCTEIFNNITETKMYKIIQEIDKAIKDGYFTRDPDNPNNILIYRAAGQCSPEGLYSENILEVAEELTRDEKQYEEFYKSLQDARKETENWFSLVDDIRKIIEPINWDISIIDRFTCELKTKVSENEDFSFRVSSVENLQDFVNQVENLQDLFISTQKISMRHRLSFTAEADNGEDNMGQEYLRKEALEKLLAKLSSNIEKERLQD